MRPLKPHIVPLAAALAAVWPCPLAAQEPQPGRIAPIETAEAEGATPQAAPFNARADLDRGRFLKVLADAETHLGAHPDDAMAWAAKAQALCALVRPVEAEAAADRALTLRPGLADALVARATVMAGKAISQRNLGSLRMVSKAMEDLRESVKADPDYPLAWQTLALGYQTLPAILGGSTKKALDSAEQLKRLDPARGLALQGRVLSLDGRWAEAAPVFGQALELAPGDPEVAGAYFDSLDEKSTAKALGEAVQRQTQEREARRLLPGLRRKARGVEAVSQALFDAGLPEEAWGVALEALPHVEAPSIVRYQLGKVAARAGIHREEGLAFLDRAAGEPLEGGTGGYSSVHWRRGQILLALGRREEAGAAAREALKHDPNNRGAKKLLEETGSDKR